MVSHNRHNKWVSLLSTMLNLKRYWMKIRFRCHLIQEKWSAYLNWFLCSKNTLMKFLKIFFTRTTELISTNLGTMYSWGAWDSSLLKWRVSPFFKRRLYWDSKTTLTKSKNCVDQIQPNLMQCIFVWRGLKCINSQKKIIIYFFLNVKA